MITCSLEDNLIQKSDFECIGQVAKHCNWEQLCVFIREQTNLWLIPKIGYCLVNKIVSNPENELIKKIWCGSEYECTGKLMIHFGLKRVLIHASYAAYIFRHGYIDTSVGVVQKINQDSVAAPINELKSIMNEHYRNADMYLEMVKDYLCTIKNEELIKDCVHFDCKNCGCGSKSENKDIQNRNPIGKNITKWNYGDR
ncbi:hypothetical protein KBP46_09885 [Chryseobacterium sp. PCH239]|uniref:DUF6712 family protein n=1 Tax=Chryseobacterium sp. PCH239 TaxID=2825845 RepID=UPI001C12249B|nr:hypothetical protein [Chryseobacterium sp. PCH239]QWT88105.1 hypothetical protein KBP46_09885 [Chryseobacterium sp. PCH239]